MSRIVLASMALAVATAALAEDKPTIAPIDECAWTLHATQEQREAAQNQSASTVARANATITALQKRIEELEAKAKVKDKPK